MEFYSLQFIFFLIAALLLYYSIGRKSIRVQNLVLLGTSLVFYFLCGWKNLIFLLATAGTTFLGAKQIQKLQDRFWEQRASLDKDERKRLKAAVTKRKRLVLWLVLLVNIGILAYLKYWDTLLGYFGMHRMGNLLLPLGISYYTFQSIGYLLDVYRAKYNAEIRFDRYLLFVSWFPQLIQGPINRYDQLGVQFEENHSFEEVRMRRAILRIGYGLLKKKALADLLSGVVYGIFPQVESAMPGSLIVVGILAYSAMQYADFSGGIDLVMGVSELFGLEMTENFRQPYFATSLGDFWRRWHISLGSWMRDYIFYPFALSGSMQKVGKWARKKFGKHLARTLPACLANLLVFLVVGLWHGAEVHFLLWGLYNGLVIALSDLLAPLYGVWKEKLHIDDTTKRYHVFRILRTFVIVNIGWYFDIIERFDGIVTAFANTVTNFGGGLFGYSWHYYGLPTEIIRYLLVLVSILFVFAVSVRKERGHDVRGELLERPFILQVFLCFVIGLLILVSFTYASGAKGFMYANF